MKIFVLLLITVIAFTQSNRRTAGREDPKVKLFLYQMNGGYRTSSADEVLQLRAAGPFVEIQKSARNFYSLQTGINLGDIVSVEKQIVSGINFRLTFALSEASSLEQTVVITVYAQPWTKTIKVISVLPPIEGITDERGKILEEVAQN